MYREHLKRNKQNKRDYARGITLVALVITIVILIILATVTVNVALGDGGLVKRGEQAVKDTANSMEHEEQMFANLEEYIDGIIPFHPVPTPEPEGGGTAMSNMTNGVIEIKWLEGNTNNVKYIFTKCRIII